MLFLFNPTIKKITHCKTIKYILKNLYKFKIIKFQDSKRFKILTTIKIFPRKRFSIEIIAFVLYLFNRKKISFINY
jgi:hypothetical protein